MALRLISRSGRAGGGRKEAHHQAHSFTMSQRTIEASACDVGICADAVSLQINNYDYVLHAGGVQRLATFAKQDASLVREVGSSKTVGGVVLANLKACMSTSSTIFFSSVAAFFGCPGQANYDLANAVLDDMAMQGKFAGVPTVSIQWGPWAGTGMAANHRQLLKQLDESGLGVINPRHGIEAMNVLLLNSSGIYLASPLHFSLDQSRAAKDTYIWESVLALDFKVYPTSCNKSVEEHLNSSTIVHSGHDKQWDANASVSQDTYTGTSSAIETIIQDALRGMLGRGLDTHEPFAKAGVDSLAVVELTSIIASAFTNLHLPPTILYDYPNVDSLSKYLFASISKQRKGASVVPQASSSGEKCDKNAPTLEAILNHIDDLVAESVGGATINRKQPFTEMGVDSLAAVELRSAIGLAMEVELSATALFDHPTIDALAFHVHSKLTQSFKARNGVQAHVVDVHHNYNKATQSRRAMHASMFA
eukprot:scaffold322203_cov48-Prasinocladus_malaysianus.AAC.1